MHTLNAIHKLMIIILYITTIKTEEISEQKLASQLWCGFVLQRYCNIHASLEPWNITDPYNYWIECRRDDRDIPITIRKQRTSAARDLVDGLMTKMMASYNHRKDLPLKVYQTKTPGVLNKPKQHFYVYKTVVWTIRSRNVQTCIQSRRKGGKQSHTSLRLKPETFVEAQVLCARCRHIICVMYVCWK